MTTLTPEDRARLRDLAHRMLETPVRGAASTALAEGVTALLDALDAAEAELDRLHSWAGLMELLDEHYPADLIPTAPDDPARDAGPRIVSLIRRVDAAEAAVERVRALHVRVPYADAPEYGYCGRCQRGGAAGVWPCETLRALDGDA